MTKIKRSREMLDTAMLVINNSTDEPFKANVESAIVLPYTENLANPAQRSQKRWV